jgi:DNA-binding winged helix-turn-helix (wHTH) protein
MAHEHLSAVVLSIFSAFWSVALAKSSASAELMARVWPDRTVEESDLRVHIAQLRRTLGDGQEGKRYVTNVPGRGYCFVAQVDRTASPYIQRLHGSRFMRTGQRSFPPQRSVSDAKDQVPVRTSAESYHAQAHEMTDAIAAAVTNAQAGLNWLSAQPLDLDEVRNALNSIASDGKRACEIIARLRELMNKVPTAPAEYIGSLSPIKIVFGPFELNVAERSLKKAGEVIPLGGRAFDILVTLLERPGEIVTKGELIAKVWPDVTVEEGNLRVQLSAPRKALDDGRFGNKYLKTVERRGYCFAVPATRQAAEPDKDTRFSKPSPALGRMIGRDDAVFAIRARLQTERSTTVLGAGGVGKTTVALAAGHAALADFSGPVFFVDLSPVRDREPVVAPLLRRSESTCSSPIPKMPCSTICAP